MIIAKELYLTKGVGRHRERDLDPWSWLDLDGRDVLATNPDMERGSHERTLDPRDPDQVGGRR